MYFIFIFNILFIIARRPRYTLFPYTTLFRSRVRSHSSRDSGVMSTSNAHGPPNAGGIGRGKLTLDLAGMFRCGVKIDRKSTRLNSSHVAISYAVFCLKKKKRDHKKLVKHYSK